MNDAIKIYTDGGSRGNPGPSAAGFVVIVNEKIVHKGSKYLGKGTNNQAEYSAVLLALEWLKKNISKFDKENVSFFLDSELVTNQLNGVYKIKDLKLRTFAVNAKKVEKDISVTIKYIVVRREKNKLADKLVNEELDRQSL